MTRRTTIHCFLLVTLVASLGHAVDNTASESGETNEATTPVADRSNSLNRIDGRRQRLREGMKLVNQIGSLREAGGRVAFYPDGENYSLQLLENLALERVTGDLDQPNRKWSITGIVTEYKGGNYLLLHRAVLKARVSHPASPRS